MSGSQGKTIASLPLEILDEIVMLNSADSGFWKRSPTLMAMHGTSREFRACALRHICTNKGYIRLGDPALRSLLLPNMHNSRLGGIAPYIKALKVTLFDGYPSHDLAATEYSNLDLLVVIREQSPLHTLTLRGMDSNGLPHWSRIYDPLRQSIKKLMKIPTLQTLHMAIIIGLPGNFLGSVWCREVIMHRAHQEKSSRVSEITTNSHIEKLTVTSSVIPTDVLLPNLQHITASDLGPRMLHVLVSRARHTLKTLNIHNMRQPLSQLMSAINLGMLPRLEQFTHEYHHSLACRTNVTGVQFIQPEQSVPNLRGFSALIIILEEMDSVETAISKATDACRVVLDDGLANAIQYPSLEEVFLNLKLRIVLDMDDFVFDEDDEPRYEATEKAIEDQIKFGLFHSFPRLHKSPIVFTINLIIELSEAYDYSSSEAS